MAHNSVKHGFFRNAFDAMVAAREKQARAYIRGALLLMDDETLKAHGYNREELKRRAHVSYPF